MKRYKKLKKKSAKKILRDEVGALHLKYLKLKRNNEDTCDICGKQTKQLGRFHIMPVGKYPKLEFFDNNILLTDWMPCHYAWHHSFAQARGIDMFLKEKLGEDYELHFKAIDKLHEPITMTYLKGLRRYFYEEIIKMGGVLYEFQD